MKKLLLPLVLLLLGTGGGIGTGLLLAPQGAAKDGAPAVGTGGEGHGHAQDDGPDEVPGAPPDGGQTEFVRLNNQFVVPVVARDRIAAMVVLSLSVEVAQGGAQAVYAREPKLRDGFLQVLFDHANRGGFDGAFTASNSLDVLRRMLTEVARDLLGAPVRSVLITEIARQDM